MQMNKRDIPHHTPAARVPRIIPRMKEHSIRVARNIDYDSIFEETGKWQFCYRLSNFRFATVVDEPRLIDVSERASAENKLSGLTFSFLRSAGGNILF